MKRPTHVCTHCGHQYQSIDNDTARKVIAAAKVNQQGPFCNVCFHLEFALRYATARKLAAVANRIRGILAQLANE